MIVKKMNNSFDKKSIRMLKKWFYIAIEILICFSLSNIAVHDFIIDYPKYYFGVVSTWTTLLFALLQFGNKHTFGFKGQDSFSILRKKDYNLLFIVSIMLISAMITCAFKTHVNKVVDDLIPTKNVEISIVDPGMLIFIDDGGKTSLFGELLSGELDGGLINGGNIIAASENFESLRLSAKAYYNSYISFVRNAYGAVVDVSCGENHQYINLSSETEDEYIINVFPFEQEKGPLLHKILFYFTIYLAVFLLLLLLVEFINVYQFDKECFLLREYNTKWWWLFFPALYLYSIFQASIGVSYSGEYGDQMYYWMPLISNKGLDFEEIASWIFAPRGYWGNVFPTISKLVGDIVSIKPIYVFLFFPSFVLSILFGVYLPRIYTLLNTKKPPIVSVISSLVLFLMFWNGMLSSVLSDVFALFFFTGTCLYLFEFLIKSKLGFALKFGAFSYITCSYRMTYITALLGGIGVGVIVLAYVRQRISRKKPKQYLLGLICAATAFFLVSLPQAQINYLNGHIGVLPYDYEGSWPVPGLVKDTSLTIYGANYTLRQSYIWYPFQETDAQQLSIKTQLYNDPGEYLSIPQILDVYASSPMDTMVYLVKKFFIAFDVKTSFVYPMGEIEWRESRGILFSFENYMIIASALFLLFFVGENKKRERCIFLFMLVFIAFPQMFTHIEWRYFLPLYLWCYYMVAYHLIPEPITLCDNSYFNRSSKLYPVQAFFILALFVINFSISA